MNSLKKNLVYNILYQILLVFLPLITAPYISRTLGAEAVGIYSYTYSVVYYFMLVAMLGIANHGNRSIAAVRNDQSKLNVTFSSIYVIQMVTHLIAISIYIAYVSWCDGSIQGMLILQIAYIFSGLFDISWLFFGLEEFRLTVVRNVLIKIGTVLMIFSFVRTPKDLWIYIVIMSFSALLSQVYLWFHVGKYVKLIRITLNEIVKHIKPIVVLFVPVLAYSIYKVMDKIMLGNMSTFVQVGYYQNAEKIINIPMSIITAIGTVMLPRVTNMISIGEMEKTKDYIRFSTRFVTILTLGIAFGLMGICENFAPVFYGEEFFACGSIIYTLAFSVVFIGWANIIRTQYLIPQHKDQVYLISTILGAIANLIINFLLIPQFAAVGAAVGTIVAEAAVFMIQAWYVRKEVPIVIYICKDFPFFVSGGVMLYIVRYVGKFFDDVAVALSMQVCVGMTFYLICIVGFCWVSNDELWFMMSRVVKCVLKKVT